MRSPPSARPQRRGRCGRGPSRCVIRKGKRICPEQRPEENTQCKNAIVEEEEEEEEEEIKNILDIGGSTGIDALTLRDRFNISVKYNILENHTLVDLMKKKNYVHSNYFSSLDEFKSENQNSEIDFIYTRGTLHYLDKPYDLLEKMKSLNPKIIFLCNVNFGSKNEAYSEYSMFRHHIQGYTLGKLKNRNANLNDKILIPAHSLKLEKVKNIFYPEYKVFREYEVDGTQTNNNFCQNIYFQRI